MINVPATFGDALYVNVLYPAMMLFVFVIVSCTSGSQASKSSGNLRAGIPINFKLPEPLIRIVTFTLSSVVSSVLSILLSIVQFPTAPSNEGGLFSFGILDTLMLIAVLLSLTGTSSYPQDVAKALPKKPPNGSSCLTFFAFNTCTVPSASAGSRESVPVWVGNKADFFKTKT